MSGQEPDNKAYGILSLKEDFVGSIIWYGWTTITYSSKYYTGRFQASRGDQAGKGQTGEVKNDLQRTGLTWEEAESVAHNRQDADWSCSVAQCIHMDVSWIKVKDSPTQNDYNVTQTDYPFDMGKEVYLNHKTNM